MPVAAHQAPSSSSPSSSSRATAVAQSYLFRQLLYHFESRCTHEVSYSDDPLTAKALTFPQLKQLLADGNALPSSADFEAKRNEFLATIEPPPGRFITWTDFRLILELLAQMRFQHRTIEDGLHLLIKGVVTHLDQRSPSVASVAGGGATSTTDAATKGRNGDAYSASGAQPARDREGQNHKHSVSLSMPSISDNSDFRTVSDVEADSLPDDSGDPVPAPSSFLVEPIPRSDDPASGRVGKKAAIGPGDGKETHQSGKHSRSNSGAEFKGASTTELLGSVIAATTYRPVGLKEVYEAAAGYARQDMATLAQLKSALGLQLHFTLFPRYSAKEDERSGSGAHRPGTGSRSHSAFSDASSSAASDSESSQVGRRGEEGKGEAFPPTADEFWLQMTSLGKRLFHTDCSTSAQELAYQLFLSKLVDSLE
jgi:hypothetical protein